jgi:hypothetical protein
MNNKTEEITKFREMANNGCLDSMYWLASALLVSDSSKDRAIEASKWLFLAIYLRHEKSKAVLEFINSTQDSEAFEISYQSAVSWLEEKYEEFETDKDISKWSSELYELVKKGDADNKRRAAIKLVWSKGQ